jgi:hypothetical protein
MPGSFEGQLGIGDPYLCPEPVDGRRCPCSFALRRKPVGGLPYFDGLARETQDFLSVRYVHVTLREFGQQIEPFGREFAVDTRTGRSGDGSSFRSNGLRLQNFRQAQGRLAAVQAGKRARTKKVLDVQGDRPGFAALCIGNKSRGRFTLEGRGTQPRVLLQNELRRVRQSQHGRFADVISQRY